MIDYGFKESLNDYSVFTYTKGKDLIVLLIYVDDVIITGKSTDIISRVKNFIHDKFQIKDLGQLHYFLGIEVPRSANGLFLNQRKYALDLISETGLTACKPSSTPMDPKHKLTLSLSFNFV